MLPSRVYESLPFFYMLTGIVCAVLIDSTIVLISSMLLIVAGVFVLLMRRSYRKSSNKKYELYQTVYEPEQHDDTEKRSGLERRHRQAERWPMLDDAGDRIFSDRRTGERRITTV